jgi:hypothetical protein
MFNKHDNMSKSLGNNRLQVLNHISCLLGMGNSFLYLKAYDLYLASTKKLNFFLDKKC